MNRRSAFLDVSPGEQRGVVTLDDRPERLILRRDDDDPKLRIGARLAARVAHVEPVLSSAFLDLGGGQGAILPFRPEDRPRAGQFVEVEIRTEPRAGKLAVARRLGPAEGPPRLLAPGPDLPTQLRAWVKEAEPIAGRQAREVADEAEAEALASVHALPGGGDVAIEPTRALVAVDIDLGERKGADAKRVTRRANLEALPEIARLLRLKSLGGLVVIDLVGRGHDGPALLAAARSAFGPDNPGVAIGPVGRFGTMELAVPRRSRPLAEVLGDAGGALSRRSLAQRLVRRLLDEAEAQPGARLTARCHPAVAAAFAALSQPLAARIGARFAVHPDPAFPPDRLEVGFE